MVRAQSLEDQSALDALEQVPLLAHFPGSWSTQLLGKAALVEVAHRTVVYLPGDPGDALFVVAAGRVKLSQVTGDGKELTLAYRAAGDFFGEQALFTGQPREEMAEAMDDVRLVRIERIAFERILERHHGLVLAVLEIMLERRRELEKRIERLVFRDVTSKLAEQLLNFAESVGVKHARGILLAAKITHRELANLIGATRETVSVTLSQMRQRGLIENDGRRVIVIDSDGLRALI